MTDVCAVLRTYTASEEDFIALVRALEDTPTAQRNRLFAELVRRIARAGHVPPRTPEPPGELLTLMEPEQRLNLSPERR